MSWTYTREENNNFETRIPEEKIRIRIKSVEKAKSSADNDMLVFQFDVSGYPDVIYHYITFLKDKPEVTNKMLTQFFDSFKDIKDGDFNFTNWIGKVGAAKIKHEEYNGSVNAKISWFVAADKQGDLSPWQEPNRSNQDGGQPTPDQAGFMAVEGTDVPFF